MINNQTGTPRPYPCPYCGLGVSPQAYHEGAAECQKATRRLAGEIREMLEGLRVSPSMWLFPVATEGPGFDAVAFRWQERLRGWVGDREPLLVDLDRLQTPSQGDAT